MAIVGSRKVTPYGRGVTQQLTGDLAALLVTQASDILTVLGISQHTATAKLKSDDPLEQTIIMLLQEGITDGGELLATSQLNASQFAQAMTMLEIKGVLSPLGNNQWKLS